MAVTIKNQIQTDVSAYRPTVELSLDKFEVYGRLKLTREMIAQLEGLSRAQIGQHMRRPELKMAYERGRAHCIVAVRQKQLQLALAGSERMLIHASEHFADQYAGEGDEPEDFEPARHTWEDALREKMSAIQKKYLEADSSEGD